MDFLGPTITPNGVTLQKLKITQFIGRVKFLRFKKVLQRYLAFLNYYRNYLPSLAERQNCFFLLPKTTGNKYLIFITPELMNEFRQYNDVLDKCCQLALCQPLPEKQLLSKTGGSLQVAGFAVLTRNDLYQKITSTRKIYAPLAYGSKTFIPS